MRKARRTAIVLALVSVMALVMIIAGEPVVIAGQEMSRSSWPIPSAGDQWAMTYDSTDWEDSETAYSVQETSDGGFILAGTVAPTGSNSGARVIKVTSNGVIAWQRTFHEDDNSGLDIINSIQETADGGYIAAGLFWTSNFQEGGPWVLKLNSDGSTAWQKAYGNVFWFNSIRETSDGGFVVVGILADVVVLKLNSDGSVAWQQNFDIHNLGNEVYQIQETSDGGFIIATSIQPPYGSLGAWIVKLNSDGDIAWQKVYGTDLQEDTNVLSAIQETDGGYIAAGYTDAFGAGSTDAWVMKVNGEGAIVWQKTVGGAGSDVANAIQVTGDGNYVVAGYTDSFGAGSSDAWVFKLNGDGELVWQKTYGGSEGDSAEDIGITSDGGYVVAGSTDSFSADDGDFWVLKLDNLGEIANCALMGNSQAIVNDALVEVIDLEPTVEPYPVEVGDVTHVSQDIRVDSAVLCGAPDGCALEMAASHNGAELILNFDLYTGPENVTWGASLNVMGNWFPLWQTPLPADTSYQNTITLPFPHFGNVAVFTALVAPPNGIVCADYELVDTGAPAAHGELPPINKLPRESLGLPPDE